MKKCIVRTVSILAAAVLTLSLTGCFLNLNGRNTADDEDLPLTREDVTSVPSWIQEEVTDGPDDPGQSGDGDQTFSGSWPDNEFTRLIPRPGFSVMAIEGDGEFSAVTQSASMEQIKAYAAKVKASGFTVDVEEEEQSVYGISMYTFSAANSDGYTVDIAFASGSGSITVKKD